MSQAIVTESKLTAIANAIRSKTGGSSPLTLDDMATEIANISGGGGGGSQGDYEVLVLDYDGTVIDQVFLDANETYTLPSAPSHTGLVFKSWSASETIVNGAITVTDMDVMIGATYTTSSGKNEFILDLAKGINSKEVSFYAYTGKTIEWGDGLTDIASSDGYVSHTYNDYGKYTITYNGNIIYGNSATAGILNQNGSRINYSLIEVRCEENTTFSGDYVFQRCYSLKHIVFPANLTSFGNSLYNLFFNCYSLEAAILPSTTTYISSQIFSNCYSLKNVVFPISATSMGGTEFDYCRSLKKIVLPRNLSLGGSDVRYCYQLEKVHIPNLSSSIFNGCSSLKNIKIVGSITSISSSAFSSCTALEEYVIPSGVTSIASSAFSGCYTLKKIVFPSSLTSIAGSAFQNCYCIKELDFTASASVPTLVTNALNGVNKTARIYVPDSLYNTWISATNWTNYASWIYKASERS